MTEISRMAGIRKAGIRIGKSRARIDGGFPWYLLRRPGPMNPAAGAQKSNKCIPALHQFSIQLSPSLQYI